MDLGIFIFILFLILGFYLGEVYNRLFDKLKEIESRLAEIDRILVMIGNHLNKHFHETEKNSNQKKNS